MFQSEEKILEVSAPKVMQSAAGFYIGSDCLCEVYKDDGSVDYTYRCPYDRYSGYMSETQANQYLENS